MDRTRRRPGLLIATFSAAVATAGVGVAAATRAPPLPVLRAERWLAPGADAAAVLTRRPVECLATPADPDAALRVEVGRAAFRNPLLLGGQAARVGVSCEACHRNGRSNPDFFFPGVSGAPGTADVTSYVFSSHRGDDLMDPRPIPDLAGPTAGMKISRAPGSPALATFIRAIVTQEFDGRDPPPAVLEGLVAYVRALHPGACATTAGHGAVTTLAAIDDVRRAVVAARASVARGDSPTAEVMIQAARAMLGDMAERYQGPALTGDRARLAGAARDLTSISDRLRGGDIAAAPVRLDGWEAQFDRAAPTLIRDGARSLYNPERLTLALRIEDRRRGSAVGDR